MSSVTEGLTAPTAAGYRRLVTPDVVVVGGSIAGCTAAKLYADAGAEVVVLEKHADPKAHKVVCTHFIQPSAAPVIERLGLARRLDEAGANHNRIDFRTPYGWVRPELPEDWPYPRHGYNVRRSVLDPALRELAASAGVDVRGGHTARELLWEGDRVAGVVAQDRQGRRTELRPRLVVAADGRGSPTARLARVPARIRPHNRFAYFAHFRGARLTSGDRSQLWFLDPDAAFAFPNDDGITVIGTMPARERLPEFRADPEAALRRLLASLPDGPDLSGAERVGKVVGKLELANEARAPAAKGMAFVGDAAQASDPLWGVGCGWAFQSAAWLVDETAPALGDRAALDRALRRYRRVHLRRLGPHHFMASDYATGRPFNPGEKLLYRAAARDNATALRLARVGERHSSPAVIATPRALGRAAWVNLRAALPA